MVNVICNIKDIVIGADGVICDNIWFLNVSES